MWRLKLASNLNYIHSYGTTGPNSTKEIRSYFALPMWFWKLVVSASAMIIKNKGYVLFIGTQFLHNMKPSWVTRVDICIYLTMKSPWYLRTLPLYPMQRNIPTLSNMTKECLYWITKLIEIDSLNFPLLQMPMNKLPFFCKKSFFIPPQSQYITNTLISVVLSKKTYIEFYTPPEKWCYKPHVMLWILDTKTLNPSCC